MITLFVTMGVLRTLSGNSNQVSSKTDHIEELITVWWQVFICQRLVSPLSVPLRDEMDANREEPQRCGRAIPLLGSPNALASASLSCGRQSKYVRALGDMRARLRFFCLSVSFHAKKQAIVRLKRARHIDPTTPEFTNTIIFFDIINRGEHAATFILRLCGCMVIQNYMPRNSIFVVHD